MLTFIHEDRVGIEEASGNACEKSVVAMRSYALRRTRRAMILAAIVNGRITFEFEGSEGEEAGRRRGERWDQDHSVDRLMGCNTVAITGPFLLSSASFAIFSSPLFSLHSSLFPFLLLFSYTSYILFT